MTSFLLSKTAENIRSKLEINSKEWLDFNYVMLEMESTLHLVLGAQRASDPKLRSACVEEAREVLLNLKLEMNKGV